MTVTTPVQCSFKRVEKKYLLTEVQYHVLMKELKKHMQPDEYANYTISNIYFDTEDYRLIRASLDKPVYKEKLRVRSYGVPTESSPVFVELKKKFDDVVYKRRVVTGPAVQDTLAALEPVEESQIGREINWFMQRERPLPRVFIGYEREAWAGIETPELRVTFDRNIRWRRDDLDLRAGTEGELLLPKGQILMEVKIPGAAPLWLARLFSRCGAKPVSFSKYGTYYTTVVLPELAAAHGPSEIKEALRSA